MIKLLLFLSFTFVTGIGLSQNGVVYNNLAVEVARSIHNYQNQDYTVNGFERIHNSFYSVMNNSLAFTNSLKKLDTSGIGNPKLALLTNTFQIFIQNINTDTFSIEDLKKKHTNNMITFLCNCLEKTSYSYMNDTLQLGVYERCMDRFYKDTTNRKDLQQIIIAEKVFYRSYYNQYNSWYYYLQLLKNCEIYREKIFKVIVKQLDFK